MPLCSIVVGNTRRDVLPQGNHFIAGYGAGVAGSRRVRGESKQMLDDRGLGGALHLALQTLHLRGLPGSGE